MKLLIVGLGKEVGGIETLFYNLFKNKLPSISVSIVTFDKECAFEKEYKNLGYNIYHLPSRKSTGLKFDFIVKSFLRDHSDYDYIWINTSSNSMYQFQVYGKKHTNAKIITHSHGTAAYMGKFTLSSIINNILNTINRPMVRKYSDYLFACSYAAGCSLFGSSRKEDIILLKNGINIEKFKFNPMKRDELRGSLNVNDDTVVIGMVGRLSIQKNPIKGIEIFREYHQLNANSILLLCGDGEMKKDVIDRISELQLQNAVHMLGVRKDVERIMSAMDILIMPSLFEGLPIVGIEAQCSGIQCFFSTAITDEVAITKGAHFVGLEETGEKWAEIIAKVYSPIINRETCYETIRAQGYDIEQTKNYIIDLLAEEL